MRQSLLLGTLAYLEELGFDTDNTNIQQTKTRQKETLMKLFAVSISRTIFIVRNANQNVLDSFIYYSTLPFS